MPNLVYMHTKEETTPFDGNRISVGSLIEYEGRKFRVIVQNKEYVIIIETEITKYRIYTYRTAVFVDLIQMGEIHKIPEKNITKFPSELMSEADQQVLELRVSAIQRMFEKIYPDYSVLQQRRTCPAFEEFRDIIGVRTTRAHVLVRTYLQSGFDPLALADRRKCNSGRIITEPDVAAAKKKNREGKDLSNKELEAVFFNEVAEKFERVRGKQVSLKSIYDDCIRLYYSIRVDTPTDIVLHIKEDAPSYDRTRRFVLSHTGLSQIRLGYNTETDFRNNHRLLTGNAKYGVVGACDTCEMDECATDIYLVSQDDRTQVTHRVVMYLLIDVKTSTIIACWPDFQDNSYVGATNCFLTLCEEHNVQTAKYGVTVTDDIFPSQVLPRVLRCDHGAEYMSKEFERFCGERNIILDPVAPGTGSLKGYVEQAFHQFHTMVMGEAANKGAIIKDNSSNHYAKACADINDARKICFEFVKYFNQHVRSNDYPLTPEQIKAGIPAIPCKLWQFEVAEHDTPRRITENNREQFLYSLLLANETFKISRQGIYCKGRYYYCDEPWLNRRMYDCGNKKRNIEARYDPRSAGAIYLLVDKELKRVPLASKREEQLEYANMTWAEANGLHSKKQQTNKEYKTEDYARQQATKQLISDVFAEAKKAQGGIAPKKEGMREAAAREKQALANENRIERKVNHGSDISKNKALPVRQGLPDKQPDTDLIMDDFEGNPFL